MEHVNRFEGKVENYQASAHFTEKALGLQSKRSVYSRSATLRKVRRQPLQRVIQALDHYLAAQHGHGLE